MGLGIATTEFRFTFSCANVGFDFHLNLLEVEGFTALISADTLSANWGGLSIIDRRGTCSFDMSALILHS